MASTVIVGLQWGDEGKGKVVDLYAESADTVVRFGGGANAGHTLVVQGKKVVTHLMPSGVLWGKSRQLVLGDGMVIDPEVLLQEMNTFQTLGLLGGPSHFHVGQRAHVVLPLHKELDRLREQGSGAIGTTRRGIGPAYEAKAARTGVHMMDLLRPDRLRERMAKQWEMAEPFVTKMGGALPDFESAVSQYVSYGKQLAPYVHEITEFVDQQVRAGKKVLFEGAQGILLDLDHGTYPYVTSSNTLASAACISCGVGPTAINEVVGVLKAYTTRVGGGPFPTELFGPEGEALREAGGEYGATTGRPRRCGWLDIVALRAAVRWNGLTGFAMTKLDVLSGKKTIQVATSYRIPAEVAWSGREERVDSLPLDIDQLQKAVPVYESFPGWEEPLSGCRRFEELPSQAKNYIARVEQWLGVPCHLVSVGPGREETIVRRSPF